jgi:hypothetical protein
MNQLSRRAFAESLACAALAPLVGVPPDAIRLPAWTVSGEPKAAPGALARALAQAIRSQYGARLSTRDLTVITRQIQSGLERVEQLRKVPLSNGDEPDFVFTAPPPRRATR